MQLGRDTFSRSLPGTPHYCVLFHSELGWVGGLVGGGSLWVFVPESAQEATNVESRRSRSVGDKLDAVCATLFLSGVRCFHPP